MNLISRTVVVVLLSASWAGSSIFAQAKTPPKITAIRAQLFYNGKGTFSDNILAQKDIALWNTIIGEGSAGDASTSTLVTVEVSGRNLPVGKTKMQITITGNKGRIIQRRIVAVDIYDEYTKFFAPIWLYDTGCEPIKISARLLGGSSAPVTKTIPFKCGE